MRNPINTAVLVAGLCAVVASVYAATTTGSLEPAAGTWRAYRGSGFTTSVCSANSETALLQCIAADAERRGSSTRYQLRYPNRYVTVTYSAPPPPSANRSPAISGTAPAGQVDQAYVFQPAASDPDGDKLTFSITNKPEWAQFDAATGRLSGTPGARNDGYHSGIAITASDGKASTTREFSFMVKLASTPIEPPPPPPPPTGTGSASLSWTPPTENVDGSALTDLAGFWISYGTSATALTQTIQVADSAAKAYTVPNLSPGAWYFAVRAYTSSGGESAPSNVGSKVIL